MPYRLTASAIPDYNERGDHFAGQGGQLICPHCNANLLYKERTRKRCSRCQEKFALEPKQNPLLLHDLRFQRLDMHLSQGGNLFYTASQLLHQASRKVLVDKKPNYGCGVSTLIAIGFLTFFLIQTEVIDTVLLIAGAVVLAALIWWFVIMPAGKPANYLKLPMSLKKFEGSILKDWRKTYGALPEKLLDTEKWSLLPAAVPPAQIRAVLVCPEQAVLDCLKANNIPSRLGLALLSTTKSPSVPEQAVLDILRSRPDMPLLLLHDASVEGVKLSLHVRSDFQLNDHHPIRDLGIHPYQALEHNLLRLATNSNRNAIDSLRKLAAAGGTLPGREKPFQQAEFDWLSVNYYSPLLALTPQRLIKIVVKGITQAATGSHAEPLLNASQEPDQLAQSVGFMTWPQA